MSFCLGHYSVKKEQTNNFPEGAFFVISTFLPIAIIFGEKKQNYVAWETYQTIWKVNNWD